MRRARFAALLVGSMVLASALPWVTAAASTDGAVAAGISGTIAWQTPAPPPSTGFWGRSFDLDTLTEQPYGAEATDVSLVRSCIDGACAWRLVGPHGLREIGDRPTLAECTAVTRWATEGSRAHWPRDTWLCAKTGAGLTVRLHIIAWPTRSDPTFRMGYRVWPDPSSRVVRLELTAALQIQRDGKTVRSLDVTPGERLTFVLTNTAGYQHNFRIGPDDRLRAGEVQGLPGVKPFATGTRTFTYDVTEDTLHLRFGCTVPGHYSLMQGRFR